MSCSTCCGGAGSDKLVGEGRNDYVTGAQGRDVLEGGGGDKDEREIDPEIEVGIDVETLLP